MDPANTTKASRSKAAAATGKHATMIKIFIFDKNPFSAVMEPVLPKVLASEAVQKIKAPNEIGTTPTNHNRDGSPAIIMAMPRNLIQGTILFTVLWSLLSRSGASSMGPEEGIEDFIVAPHLKQ